MAMQARDWTISALAVELKKDRRALSRIVDGHEIKPVREKGKARYYRMADIVNAMMQTTNELNLEQERAQLAKEQSRRLKRENDIEEKKLIPIEEIIDILQSGSKQAVSILDALPLNIKRRVPSLRARDINWIKTEIAKSRNIIAKVKVSS